ncbi:MAG: hypothetical protein KDE22_04165 [Rhodobacterales bacterium]|nr:hypothetical protein [Rhodobacterales bacterium]
MPKETAIPRYSRLLILLTFLVWCDAAAADEPVVLRVGYHERLSNHGLIDGVDWTYIKRFAYSSKDCDPTSPPEYLDILICLDDQRRWVFTVRHGTTWTPPTPYPWPPLKRGLIPLSLPVLFYKELAAHAPKSHPEILVHALAQIFRNVFDLNRYRPAVLLLAEDLHLRKLDSKLSKAVDGLSALLAKNSDSMPILDADKPWLFLMILHARKDGGDCSLRGFAAKLAEDTPVDRFLIAHAFQDCPDAESEADLQALSDALFPGIYKYAATLSLQVKKRDVPGIRQTLERFLEKERGDYHWYVSNWLFIIIGDAVDVLRKNGVDTKFMAPFKGYEFAVPDDTAKAIAERFPTLN